MSQTSTNLTLPFIQPSQAQKHVTHNEAIELLDVIVQLCVQGFEVDTPPVTPSEGQSWLVGAAPTGDWAGHAGLIANWAGGGWMYLTPQTGWRAVDAVTGEMRVYSGLNWTGLTVATLRLLPQATPVSAVAGDLYFDNTSSKARCFDGTAWQDLF